MPNQKRKSYVFQVSRQSWASRTLHHHVHFQCITSKASRLGSWALLLALWPFLPLAKPGGGVNVTVRFSRSVPSLLIGLLASSSSLPSGLGAWLSRSARWPRIIHDLTPPINPRLYPAAKSSLLLSLPGESLLLSALPDSSCFNCSTTLKPPVGLLSAPSLTCLLNGDGLAGRELALVQIDRRC